MINSKLSKADVANTPIELLKAVVSILSVVHLHEAEPEVIRQALEDKNSAQAPAFLKTRPCRY